jgi:hypothetical protein
MIACGLCNRMEKELNGSRKCGVNNRKIGKNIATKPHWCPIHGTNSHHFTSKKKPKVFDLCDLMCT